ncbi:DUF4150 domain-containing protein [Mesorhizobium sp. 1B3]|uniref:DUF4150 domain-containing protein n=1 Tax=Mesorhizobium sp. 1B3 TaxID=3243599 RepID=UPI003D99C012
MPSHIVVNSLGLTYKGTVGLSIATIPDVCKTPSPGGPIPLPYPNIANQSTLKNGTTTVFAKGKMIAVKGSHYSMSSGDEPGTAGGVKSNVFKKATDWITYSFDVKMDGKNACRHTDKKFHNDKNTVDLAGNFDPNTPAAGLNAYQISLWKPCVEQHDKYDAIKIENETHTNDYKTANGEDPNQTKARIWSNSATSADKRKYKKFLEERIEIFARLEDERANYILMDCDDIPWPGGKPTKQERLEGHYDQHSGVEKAIRNFRNQLASPKMAGI